MEILNAAQVLAKQATLWKIFFGTIRKSSILLTLYDF